jgi:hypothetical protein
MDPFDDESTDGQKFVGRLNAGPVRMLQGFAPVKESKDFAPLPPPRGVNSCLAVRVALEMEYLWHGLHHG